MGLPHTPFPPARSPPNKKFVYFLQSPYLFTIDRLFPSIVEMFRINFYRVSLDFSFRNTKLIVVYVIERTPIRNVYSRGVLYSDLALNKICFWLFITMSQSTKRRWNSGPSTPSSTSKKKKYNCKFQDEWKKSHHWLQSSSLGNDLAFCTLCTASACGQK